MDSHEFWEVPESMTDEEIYELSWEQAKANAEMYGIYPRDEYVDEPDFEDSDSYSCGIEGSWQDYDPARHDCYRVGGDTSWQVW